MPLRIYRRRILKEILGASSLFVGFVAMLSVSVIGILIKLHAYTTGYYRRLHLGEPNQDGVGHEGFEHLDEGDREVDIGGVGKPEAKSVDGTDGDHQTDV
ncbi:hypothetical protein MRB53_024113 [Persea americana]|uniref:Uncharacterized protein n=1 Tax=Persea americana TaxID=3435 RepID=A0ACC2LBS9_PERAE|nr:hypothetical protein MRB53_024113 [Persea americana]